MQYYYGATLGKMAVKLKVVDEKGNFMTLGQAYLRFIIPMIYSILNLMINVQIFMHPDFQNARTMLEIEEVIRNAHNFISPYFLSFSNLYMVILVINYSFVFFNLNRRAIHDLVAKTYCVYSVR